MKIFKTSLKQLALLVLLSSIYMIYLGAVIATFPEIFLISI